MTSSPKPYFPLSVCYQLTQAISRTARLDEIYEAALDALQRGVGVTRASILVFDPDGVMRFKAWRHLSARYRAAVEGHTPWTRETQNAEPVVVPNVEEQPDLAGFLPVIRAEHIAAMTFIPLEAASGVIGKFMLYYAEPHQPTTDELQLASLIAGQIAFAVERTRATLATHESEERLRFALHAADMGTWDWDLRTNSVRWSDNLEKIHGLAPGTFDGTFDSYTGEIHPEDRARVLNALNRAAAGEAPYEVEYRVVRPDGTIQWVEGKGRVERGADGRPLMMTGVCVNVTPRKEAEFARVEALEQSSRASQRLAAIVESSGDGIVSKDLNGTIMSWNRGAEQMFGYTAAEAIGRSIKIIIPANRLAEEDMVLAHIRAGEPVEMETVRQHKDGSHIDISLMVSPVRDGHGRIVGASKIARDIRARKRDEAERAELYRRLTTLVTASATLLDSPETESVREATVSLARQLLVADGYAIWISGPDHPWRIVKSEGISSIFANRIIDSYRGRPVPPAAIFTGPLAITDVSAQPMVDEQLAAYVEEGIKSMLVCPMRLGTERSGTLVFYYRVPRAFTDVDVQTAQALANIASAAMTTVDLYEHQRRLGDVSESARRQASFLADATSVLSRSLDYEQTLGAIARLAVPEIADWCTVHIINSAGELQQLAVAHADDERGRDARLLQERYPANPDLPGGVHEVVRTGKPSMMTSIPRERLVAAARDAEHLRLLERLAPSSYICVPLITSNGTIGALTFLYAESGRAYGDQDMAFAQNVAARAALAVDNAFSYRRAYDANRLKDEFLATLSHELRTPLNAILGYAQMLGMRVLNADRQSKAVTVLTRNAESLRQIIDDMLDVSRITSGKLRLNVQSVQVEDILRNAVASVQPAADAKGVVLGIVVAPQVAAVWGDPDRLQQIAWNLLANAVKFTPRGGHVEVSLRSSNGLVEIVVKDDGQGIDLAFLPHIFERFRQADSRFSREHGGLGLGLSIVHELVELHGGTVTAASDGPGTGATFAVRLPTILATARGSMVDEKVHVVTPAEAVKLVPDRLAGARLLAVDDEEDALGLLRVILESAGAEVTTAGSAQRALELLNHANYDALIADIGMPRMDGLELIRSIRRTLPAPVNRLPAAALTAYARSEDRVTALASGFQLHIAKPVNPSELVTAVATLLGR